MSDDGDDGREEPQLPLDETQLLFFPTTPGGQRILEALLDKHGDRLDLALTDACDRLAAYDTLTSSGFHRGALANYDRAVPSDGDEN